MTNTSVAIVGAGIVGLATAHYLCARGYGKNLTVIDQGAPMGFTSAQSGENYRNWWPHPVMQGLMDASTDLMEEIVRKTDNSINMTRRGYVLATRKQDFSNFLSDTQSGVRIHERSSAAGYTQPSHWEQVPDGVDVLAHQDLIKAYFPYLDDNVNALIHIRRGGDISGQQMGQYFLESIREAGGKIVQAKVNHILCNRHYLIETNINNIEADILVDAAGPFAGQIAEMLGVALPLINVRQEKIAFDDHLKAIPRTMPFAIDLDGQSLRWEQDERALLVENDEFSWMADEFPGGIHCRPDGGTHGTWVRLGWAYNTTPEEPALDPELSPYFPDIVLRGASRLNQALAAYIGKLPRKHTHYGGYYTMTEENWPLIGPMGKLDGAYMVAGMSGFGTMAACGVGKLCADWISGAPLPNYADALSFKRYDDLALMAELEAGNKGVL